MVTRGHWGQQEHCGKQDDIVLRRRRGVDKISAEELVAPDNFWAGETEVSNLEGLGDEKLG
jgi:hypothetical protein